MATITIHASRYVPGTIATLATNFFVRMSSAGGTPLEWRAPSKRLQSCGGTNM